MLSATQAGISRTYGRDSRQFLTSITEPEGQSLADTRDTIRKTLEAERDRSAVNAFVAKLKARWKRQTDCREGYATVECRNGPKERPKPPEISILD